MLKITAAIPYGFSALAQIKWRRADHKAGQNARFVRDMIIAVFVLVFSILFIWYSRLTGQSPWVYWAPFFLAGGALLLGIPVYASPPSHRAGTCAAPTRRTAGRRAASPDERPLPRRRAIGTAGGNEAVPARLLVETGLHRQYQGGTFLVLLAFVARHAGGCRKTPAPGQPGPAPDGRGTHTERDVQVHA